MPLRQTLCDAESTVALQLDDLNIRVRINLEISGLLAGAHELSLEVESHEMFNVVYAADCQLIHGLVISPPRPEPRRMSRLAAASLMQPAAQADSETWF